jgi:hypothetical protein
LRNLALLWAKNANLFAKFFGENIFKITTSVPSETRSWNVKKLDSSPPNVPS